MAAAQKTLCNAGFLNFGGRYLGDGEVSRGGGSVTLMPASNSVVGPKVSLEGRVWVRSRTWVAPPGGDLRRVTTPSTLTSTEIIRRRYPGKTVASQRILRGLEVAVGGYRAPRGVCLSSGGGR